MLQRVFCYLEHFCPLYPWFRSVGFLDQNHQQGQVARNIQQVRLLFAGSILLKSNMNIYNHMHQHDFQGIIPLPAPNKSNWKKLDGCTFNVNSTEFCPSNQTEWNKRSSEMNCSETNAYMCVPNERFTQLVEFCYDHRTILIFKGNCLYFSSSHSDVNVYDCRNFEDGCPSSHYLSSEIYKFPSCIHVENGCFVAEGSCKRGNQINYTTLAISLGVSVSACVLCLLLFYFIRERKFHIRRKVRRGTNMDMYMEESIPLFEYENREAMETNKESRIEEDIFDDWKQDDFTFITTKACNKVENMIESRNLVIVAGNSGSGKSAIIQHIALKYRQQGWTVKPVQQVKDIVDEYYSIQFQKNKTICVFNDPFGKESFDEILNNSWQTYEEELKLYLKKEKLIMSCRNHIISDARLTCILVNHSHIVNIDDDKNKLSVDEKREILTKYTFDMNLSNNDCDKIVEVESYFPLLCKLYSSKEKSKKQGIEFFTEPVTVMKEEILGLKKKDKKKYWALALLVLFNDDLCVNDLLKYKDRENKFKRTLKLFGLPINAPPSAIKDNIESLIGNFIKKIGDTYHFYHDFVMDVTTYVFGTDYPAEIIKYADISFLRRRLKLGNCDENDDPFTIYLSDRYTEKLGERLYTELFGERLLDVVFNPCLRNEMVIRTLKTKFQCYPNKLPMLLQTKKLTFENQDCSHKTIKLPMSEFDFVGLESAINPVFLLIVFSHTDLSRYYLDTLRQRYPCFISSSLLSAVYCNGSMKLFHMFSKDLVKESLTKDWGGFYPVHIVSVFHNYELLEELIKINIDVNLKSCTWEHWSPLILASCNNTKGYGKEHQETTSATRRDKTVKLLLKKGADINLRMENGASPLFTACQNGHDSTVHLLLRNGANINLCKKNGAGSLFIACQNGHDSTVQLLLHNGANINLCKKDGASPLYTACQNGHDSTVQLLLSNGADINLCEEGGASPLYTACQIGHDSTVQLLLSNGADISLCKEGGASPLFIACYKGHDRIVQLLLSYGADINLCKEDGAGPLYTACQNGHNSIVQLLLSTEADINLCKEGGVSPLFIACQNGHDNNVQLLLSNGANIDLCKEDGASPLFIACQNGHDSTVQLLLSYEADINLCKEGGASPLFIACYNGHDSTVQLLLSNGADINLCEEGGVSPLFIACYNGHDSTVHLLLSKGADINLCKKNGAGPLFITCQNGNDSTVQLLLCNKADINLCEESGASPLFIACCNGHDSTVQLLLSNGADINLCKEGGVSPLFIACQNGHDSTVQLLLSNRANINLCKEDRASPLFIACQNGHNSTVQLLLSYGANINLCKKNGAGPLFIACYNGHDSTVQLLLSNGADINLCKKDGASPLFTACQNGHDSTVQLLLSIGADINLCKKDGASSLFTACQNGHNSTVQLLLSNGADINLCEEGGASPLFEACYKGHDSTVQLLLSNGADINLCEEDGASPLFIACQNGHDSTVQLLLSNGADIDLCKEDRASPLFIACQNGHNSTVQLLLSYGADINLCKKNGAGPLFIACCNGHDSTVQLLLNNGADTSLCLKEGVSPLYVAFEKRLYVIVDILIKHGADTSLFCGWGANPDLKDCFDKNDGTVKFLLQEDNIGNNMYDPDSYFSLFVWCQVERVTRMIFKQ